MQYFAISFRKKERKTCCTISFLFFVCLVVIPWWLINNFEGFGSGSHFFSYSFNGGWTYDSINNGKTENLFLLVNIIFLIKT